MTDVSDTQPSDLPPILTIEEFATHFKLRKKYVSEIIREGRFERAGGRVLRFGRNNRRIPLSVVHDIEDGRIDLGDLDG